MFNVNELLLCALPYHATPEFARLLVLLQLKGSEWEWLTPGQQSGAPPPREALVRRCVNDHVRAANALGSLLLITFILLSCVIGQLLFTGMLSCGASQQGE